MRARIIGFVITVIIGSVLAGCGGGQVTQAALQDDRYPLDAFPLTAAQARTIQSQVRQTMKDPDSAKFSEVVAGKDRGGVIFACGYVNAKNSYGGYTGRKAFIGRLATNGTFTLDDLDERIPRAENLCHVRNLIPRADTLGAADPKS